MENCKEKKTGWQSITAVACLICLIIGGTGGYVIHDLTMSKTEQAMLQEYRLIEKRFVGEYDREAYEHSVLASAVVNLGDRWSYYLTPDEYTRTLDTRANAYVGIGVAVLQDEKEGLLVINVTHNGPAEEAGIVPGDRIIAVDGETITQDGKGAGISDIKGEENTMVELEVLHVDGSTDAYEVERRSVQEQSVEYSMLEGETGLIRIYNFYTGTGDQTRLAVQNLIDEGAKALVIDVRNDPGGYITELTDVLDILLPEGDTFTSISYSGKKTVYHSDADSVSVPIAVLVNGDSYSAAEFLAAQMRESAGSLVIGEQTCGKGYSQGLFKLKDGSAIGLSVSRYYTASGQSLIGKGVKPDIELALTEEDSTLLLYRVLPVEEDIQLKAAVEALRSDT